MACGGATSTPLDGEGTEPTKPAATSADPPASQPPSTGNDTPKVDDGPKIVGAECPNPTSVLAASGGTITRPAGSALRLRLVYQGASIGVTNVRGVDMILAPNGGPYTPGGNSGYWFETRSATTTTYQRLFRDPTNQEAPGGPNGEPFMNSTIGRCVAKTFEADVPNNSAATEIVIYGSPYGTQDLAVELARFAIK